MARLVILASPDLADGFRLAGAATIGVSGDEADAVLAGVAAEPGVGLVFVTDDLWSCLEPRTKDELERLGRPIATPIPAGRVADASGRRAVIEEMLQRAIGFRMDLAGGPAPAERRSEGAA